MTSNMSLRKQLESIKTDSGAQQIRVVDHDEDTGLDLLCYDTCSESDPDIVRNCRGVVFAGDTMVMRGFPYTPEYPHTDEEAIRQHVGDSMASCIVNEAFEGVLIRVFFYKKWYVSTHRKLNAFRSKWAARQSFGDAFVDALKNEIKYNTTLSDAVVKKTSGVNATLDENNVLTSEEVLDAYLGLLDKSKQYMFIVSHSGDNQIVCTPPEESTCMHVGTFVNRKLVLDEEAYIPKPQCFSMDSVDKLISQVNSIDPKEIQGVIVFLPDGNQFKIMHSEYLKLFEIRGNEPSILFRFLQLLTGTQEDREKIALLEKLYPEKIPKFALYRKTIKDISSEMHSVYIQRYIRKEFIKLPREEFNVLKRVHSNYMDLRKNHAEFYESTGRKIPHVSIVDIENELLQQPPSKLNHMIRHRLYDTPLPQVPKLEPMTKENFPSLIPNVPVTPYKNSAPTTVTAEISRTWDRL